MPDGIPFYRSKEVIERAKGNKISTELFISEEQFSEIEKKFGAPKPGDILLTSVGTLGVSWQVEEDTQFYFKDGNLTWFRNFDSKLDSKYLMYWLRSRIGQQELDRISIGSTQRALTIVALKSLPFSPPPVSDQKAIAHILGTLDDKIELNQKMNQTLEEIAKAIFKSWFVDFDPVRAKAEGRPTGLPPEISDLFPHELVDSEIGEIPKGWNCQRVETFADALLGGTPSRKKSNYWGGEIPWINSGAVNEFRIIEPSEYITQEGYDKSSTKLLPAKATVIAITGATLGQVSYLEIDSCANQSVVGVIPHNNRAHEWTYLTFTAHIDRLINRQTGGAQQHINKNDVLDFDVVYPTEVLIARFSDIATPLFVRIGVAVRENLILTELRDTLLTKLISGELRIPDAEKFLEEAGI